MVIDIFEWTATFFGVLGAVTVASNSKFSPLGWIAFLISSITCSIFAYLTESFGLLTLQLVFILTNLMGLWRWLIEPYFKRER